MADDTEAPVEGKWSIEGEDKLLHRKDGVVIRGVATDAEMMFFEEIKRLRAQLKEESCE